MENDNFEWGIIETDTNFSATESELEVSVDSLNFTLGKPLQIIPKYFA